MTPSRRSRAAAGTLVAALIPLLVGACDTEAVEWHDAVPLPGQLAATTDLTFDTQGRLTPRPPTSITLPVFTTQCTASVHVARDTTGDWYGVWWSVHPDSTAEVVVSRSTDGATWAPAVTVDSTDVGRVGCARPAPAIMADGGNVHVVYSMAAREGPGIFAAHSMDRGMTFHSPVTVVYGERPGLASIAARGDLVAVAYEDPNSDPVRVALALSRSLGHIFERRDVVSPPTGPARDPRVALGDGIIAVTWTGSAAGDASAPRTLRIGDLK